MNLKDTLIIFFFLKDAPIYYIHSILPSCIPLGQKSKPDLIIDGCELPCSDWEFNSGPREEQTVLLTSEPALKTITK